MGSHPFNVADYDQPIDYTGNVTPYLICSAPRCGSTLLGSLLHDCGVMGVPHEYLHPTSVVAELAERWHINQPIGAQIYLDTVIKKRTTPNGVFGLKAHFSQVKPFLDKQPFQKLLNEMKIFIRIKRKDILAQAVSFALAHQSENWSSLQEAVNEVTYDQALINSAFDDILVQDIQWQKMFTLHNIHPIQVFYEDLLEDPNTICHDICKAVGIETDHQFKIERSPLKQQRTQLNDEWMERFRSEKKMF